MAGEARNRAEYSAVLIPWRLTSDDLHSDSSYTEDDPEPGHPTSTASPKPKLQPVASGTQDDTTSYTITTRQGGNLTPGGAGFSWRKTTDSSGDDRGYDAPNCLSSHNFIARGSATVNILTPDAAELPDGGVIVVANHTSSVTNTKIRAYILGTDESITEVDITDSMTDPGATLSSSFHPTVDVLDDESIVVCHLVEDGATEQAQVNVYRSTDTGATWTLVSRYALPAALNVDNSTSGDGYTIRRMRFRHAGGRGLLLIWVQVNNTAANSNPDGYFQFATDSEGTQFSLVEFVLDNNVSHTYDGTSQGDLSAAFGYPDITTLDDEFFVSYISTQNASSFVRLPTPFKGISEASVVTVITGYTGDLASFGGSGDFTDGEGAIASTPDGSIYITHKGINDDNYIITRTADKGDSWELLGQGITAGSPTSLANSWRPGDNMYPTNICMIAARARLYVYGDHEAPTTTSLEGSLSEWGLGGWSSVTMPGNTTFGKITGRASWSLAYFPGELPGNLSSWTKTSSGSPTETLSANGLEGTATGTETLYWTHTHAGETAEGLIVEWVQRQAAGGSTTLFYSGVSGRTEDASAGYEWQARISTTGAVLYDPIGATNVSGFSTLSLSSSTVYEYRVEQRAASVQGWYRTYTVFNDRLWTAWGTGTLTSTGGSGTPTQRVIMAAKFDATTPGIDPNAYFEGIRAVYEDETGARTLPFTNPDDLVHHDWPAQGRAVVLAGNYRLSAVGGPGRRGDSYTGAPRYGYPVDLIHWTDSLSPRETWRSTEGTTNADQALFVYQVSDIATEDTRLSPAVGVFLGGVRAWRTGVLRFKNVATTVTSHSFDLTHASFTFTRNGQTLYPSGASTSGVVVHRDECSGWWVFLDDGGGTTQWVEVETNAEGVLAGAGGMAAKLTLKDIPASTPASGTCKLVPDQAVVLVHLQDSDQLQVRLDIDSQETEDKRIHLGCAWIGDVYAFADPWELGARFTTTSGTTTTETRARVASAQNEGPPRREFEVGWTTTAYTGHANTSSADPHFSEATAHASAMPMSLPSIIPYTVEGIYRLCKGSERPLVFLPCLPKQGSGDQDRVITGRHKIIPAQITGTATVRSVAGAPCAASAKDRGEAIACRELV